MLAVTEQNQVRPLTLQAFFVSLFFSVKNQCKKPINQSKLQFFLLDGGTTKRVAGTEQVILFFLKKKVFF